MSGRAWEVDNTTVFEATARDGGYRRILNCLECKETAWCSHRQKVVNECWDAPLIRPGDAGMWLDLEIQPTIGFCVPTHLRRDDDGGDTYVATVWADLPLPSSPPEAEGRPVLPLGTFFPSDGRRALRAMFIALVNDEPDLKCTSIAHSVMKSREPQNILERWILFTSNRHCADCAVFDDTAADAPQL